MGLTQERGGAVYRQISSCDHELQQDVLGFCRLNRMHEELGSTWENEAVELLQVRDRTHKGLSELYSQWTRDLLNRKMNNGQWDGIGRQCSSFHWHLEACPWLQDDFVLFRWFEPKWDQNQSFQRGHHERVECLEQNSKRSTETVCSRRGSRCWWDFRAVSASGNLHFHCGGQLETLTCKVLGPRSELGKCSRKHLFGATLWSQVRPWAWWRTAQRRLELSGGDILFPSFQRPTEGWTWKTILCEVVLHRWVPKRNKWPLRCRTDPVTVTFHFSQVLEGTKHLCGWILQVFLKK